jgi:non-canonical poly(A) RNA polymerase PAPD5/7
MSSLSEEISIFHDYIRPTQVEAIARRSVLQRVKKSVEAVLPYAELEVFGSERTGLSFALSDIDLRLLPPNQDRTTSTGLPTFKTRQAIAWNLKKLERTFRNKNSGYVLVALRHARYPLVSMQDRHTGLDIQIVSANDTTLSRELMQKYMQEYPYLGQLYSIIKAMFDVRGLSDVFRGGLGSYSIFMMIVASLRHSSSNPSDVGAALLQFLKFWENFDTTSKGISLEPIELYDKQTTQVMPERVKRQLAV